VKEKLGKNPKRRMDMSVGGQGRVVTLKAINVSDDLCPCCDPDITIEATSFRKR
jgi:hypothetical protein